MAFEKPTEEDLWHRYSYHEPKGDQAKRYEVVRQCIRTCATVIVRNTPCSREQTRALNALDDAMMLANAAIARNE